MNNWTIGQTATAQDASTWDGWAKCSMLLATTMMSTSVMAPAQASVAPYLGGAYTARHHNTPIASVNQDPSVAKFMAALPGADLGAVQQMHDLAVNTFSSALGTPHATFEMEVDENGPVLFLTLDTHGMETGEQIRRELPMRERILADDRLRAAKQYLVINPF